MIFQFQRIFRIVNSVAFVDAIGYLRGSLALSLFKAEKHVQEVVLEMNFNLKDFKTFFSKLKKCQKSTFDWQTVLYAFKSKSGSHRLLPQSHDSCLHFGINNNREGLRTAQMFVKFFLNGSQS